MLNFQIIFNFLTKTLAQMRYSPTWSVKKDLCILEQQLFNDIFPKKKYYYIPPWLPDGKLFPVETGGAGLWAWPVAL